MFISPNPDCEKECRFRDLGGSTTLRYYAPVYDKFGNNVNPDGNITTGAVKCSICQKIWEYKKQYGNVTYREVDQFIGN